MANENHLNELKFSANQAEATEGLTHIPTTLTLTSEQFEKLYLNPPMHHHQPPLTRTFGNPTPLALGAFVLTTTPLSCALMGWRGAGGGGAAFSAILVLTGGMVMVLAGILEFVVGNTFPCVVFAQLGGFLMAFGATMTPAFNAAAPYSESTTDTVLGLQSPAFMTTFAFLFLFMAVFMFIYGICATRTNLVFTLLFVTVFFLFVLLAGAYWRLAVGDLVVGKRLTVGGGASLFAASMLGFYLFTAQIFASVGFPLSLPVGDLSGLWAGGISHAKEEA